MKKWILAVMAMMALSGCTGLPGCNDADVKALLMQLISEDVMDAAPDHERSDRAQWLKRVELGRAEEQHSTDQVRYCQVNVRLPASLAGVDQAYTVSDDGPLHVEVGYDTSAVVPAVQKSMAGYLH